MKKMFGLKHTSWAKHGDNANRDFKGTNGYNRQIRRNIKKWLRLGY